MRRISENLRKRLEKTKEKSEKLKPIKRNKRWEVKPIKKEICEEEALYQGKAVELAEKKH